MAACGGVVTALEEDEGLLQIARQVLPALAPGVTIRPGALQAGLPGPWDVIMIEGAVREIPGAIAQQLNPLGGRLVTVLAQGGIGRGVLAEPIRPDIPAPGLRSQAHFDCATPLLTPLMARPGFTF
jgi:protein-L-isoaspartate(D-aspartate) O-methyltransferase